VKIKVNTLQILVHGAVWGLVAWLLWDYFTGNLTFSPIQAATQRTGKYALILLVLSLACTPLNTVFGFRQALKVRRALGLYAFMFAAIHFAIFIGVDYAFNWEFIKLEVLDKRFMVVGFSAGLILSALALTSFRWWMKRLGKNWKRLHKLVYLVGILVIVHYAWAKKGDLFSLQGDIIQPFIFGLIILLLLLLRIPVVRKYLSNLRRRLNRRRPQAPPKAPLTV